MRYFNYDNLQKILMLNTICLYNYIYTHMKICININYACYKIVFETHLHYNQNSLIVCIY